MSDFFTVVVISGGASDPSTTRMLADRVTAAVAKTAQGRSRAVRFNYFEIRPLADEITAALTARILGEGLSEAIAALADADGIVVSTPVYNAGPSGLLLSFFQVIDDDLLIAKPVVLAATAGTARHALVVDEQMRSLFAYLRALTVPTSIFAASNASINIAVVALPPRSPVRTSPRGITVRTAFSMRSAAAFSPR